MWRSGMTMASNVGDCPPDLHGAFATRGDAFKRLALVASALDSPTPAFDAEEWETASKSKCAAINNKTEAATKRFVSLLQAEMDYGTPVAALRVLCAVAVCSDLCFVSRWRRFVF
jgi:hypothetical protein